MDIRKYEDSVQYYLPYKDTLISWEYTGKFYLGESKISKIK